MENGQDMARWIKSLAAQHGFIRAGIAPAAPVAQALAMEQWVARGEGAGMDYLCRNGELRADPSRLVVGAKSVLCLAVSYAPADCEDAPGATIARYARGRDYHKVLKKRCIGLMDAIRAAVPRFDGRAFVDSAPVMERSLAALAGLGWIGANGCLIAPGLGSYVLLCEIVSNLELPADALLDPSQSPCSRCNACVHACPTGAIGSDATVDSRRCLSYHTIENEGEIPREIGGCVGPVVFGCDLCQQVCPCNRGVAAGDAELRGSPGPALAEILAWDAATWDAFTCGRATRRASLEMFHRNAALAMANGSGGKFGGEIGQGGRPT